MLDNINIAIMTKVNELAKRYGLKPHEFLATVKDLPDNPGTLLTFRAPPTGNPIKEKSFSKMLQVLGVDQDGFLKATFTDILNALDNALHVSDRSP